MQLRPLHDRVLVKRLEESETTASGLVIPDSAKEKPRQGTAIGAGGGRVLFGKYSGSEVTIVGEELLILREDEVLAVLG